MPWSPSIGDPLLLWLHGVFPPLSSALSLPVPPLLQPYRFPLPSAPPPLPLRAQNKRVADPGVVLLVSERGPFPGLSLIRQLQMPAAGAGRTAASASAAGEGHHRNGETATGAAQRRQTGDGQLAFLGVRLDITFRAFGVLALCTMGQMWSNTLQSAVVPPYTPIPPHAHPHTHMHTLVSAIPVDGPRSASSKASAVDRQVAGVHPRCTKWTVI